ncbi:MAG: oligosaccharide flippase family protein [Bacteroidia bacterium]|nr:oligosaccharide flippase family protein [Bacteroidota bacterium]MCZ2129026.1 oligosaccharide flippase family protein [Bacteroidia bacterium]
MSAHRHFLRDSIFFQSLNWLVKPLWIFLIDREVQNHLGLEVYGKYLIHFNFTFLFIVLLDIGMHNYQTRKIAENRGFLQTGTPGLLWIKLLLSFIYMVFVWQAGLLNGLGTFWLLAIGLNQVLNSWILFFRTPLAGLHLFRIEAVVSVLDRTLAGIGCGIFLFSGSLQQYFGLKEFVLFQTAALSIGLLFVIGVCIQKKAIVTIALPDFSKFKSLFLANLPFAILTLIMNFYTRLDVIFISHLYPHNANYEAGIYAHSYRFLDAAGMYAMLFTGMLLPIFSRQLARKEDFSSILKLVLKFVLIPGMWLVVLALQKGVEIMDVLYSTDSINETLRSSSVFTWLMISYLPMSISLVLGSLLTAGNYIKNLIYATSTALLILTVACFVLVPEQGALGAAKAVFITQTSVMIFSLILAKKFFPKPDAANLKLIGKLLLVGVLIWLVGWVLDNVLHATLMWFSIGTLFTTAVLVLVFKLFNFTQLKILRRG